MAGRTATRRVTEGQTGKMTSILTTAPELHAALAGGSYPDGGSVRVLDVRWRLDRPDGLPEYREGHIPGAQYVDLDHDLAAHGDPTDGRHPIPPIETLQAAARRWGIDAGDTVVVYDDLKNMSSARAWWLLRHAGVDDVRLLDGSLRAWTDAGFDLEDGDAETPAPGSVSLTYGALPVLDLDAVGRFADEDLLLDARAGERYRARSNRSTRARDTYRAPSARRRARTSTPTEDSARPTSCDRDSGCWEPRTACRSASTAVPASRPRTRRWHSPSRIRTARVPRVVEPVVEPSGAARGHGADPR